ncbi:MULTISPECIES: DUF2252 family protein [unclassified Pseudonocardia]|uniref:DUF2252 family protein n=1 Tax=unclassified Pseudonocardia TaxID=2619320 RepID=UPI0001FFE40F|nr:DUF2252 family protein [Pseudonocardia sp. Ae707_Ps1]OLM18577.1 hypothetical protein Ae707Ps1_2836 [Pseudonocardia sp. Ae707_Ps1]
MSSAPAVAGLDPQASAGYLGRGTAFAEGILGYARAYAAQNEADHRDLRTAIAAGDVRAAERGW